MSTTTWRFGAFAPQGWKTELAGIDGAAAQWQRCLDTALTAEELGYDSIWVYDHFHNVPTPAHEAVFECWTTIAALAQATSTIRLGQMVSCTSYRPPTLTAKITSSIDVISGGRLDWGVGAGWYDHEYRAYGYEYPKPAVRIGMLREAVEVVKTMWTEPDASYEGRYYTVAGAQCDPKPLQEPHPPIWIGGSGEQLTLRVVARHANVSNFGGKPDEWRHKREVLRAHCREVGRDEDQIVKSWSPELVVRGTEAEARAVHEARREAQPWLEEWDSYRLGNLAGTAEQVLERLAVYGELGASYLVTWMPDYPGEETLRRFADDVMPELR
jgi:F420-dependent oxidoreductase-like protein